MEYFLFTIIVVNSSKYIKEFIIVREFNDLKIYDINSINFLLIFINLLFIISYFIIKHKNFNNPIFLNTNVIC